mgnify:CR=1 FL=1
MKTENNEKTHALELTLGEITSLVYGLNEVVDDVADSGYLHLLTLQMIVREQINECPPGGLMKNSVELSLHYSRVLERINTYRHELSSIIEKACIINKNIGD